MEDKHLKMLGVKLAKTLAPPPPRNVSKEENKGEGKHIRRKRQTSCTDNVGFDSRNTFQCCAGIIGAIQDQSSCGSCWAVAVSSAFTDRYCISRMKAGNPPAFNDPTARFSAADMLSCATYTSGCNGGDPYNAWLWTYTSAQMVYFLQGQGNVAAIQNEIKANGSVVAVFDLYSDFYYYSSGVYSVVLYLFQKYAMWRFNGKNSCAALNITTFALLVFLNINIEALITVEGSDPESFQGNFAFAKFFALEDNNAVRNFRPLDKRQSKQTAKEVQVRNGNDENGFAFAFAKRNVERFAKIKRGESKSEIPFAVEIVELVPGNILNNGDILFAIRARHILHEFDLY
uniref:Peptidase C1A papain C-terminal domain-containing protein n=1 Tax=Meloidogyne javanica TaxID=6303 RepID=A0A915LG12_MELJA